MTTIAFTGGATLDVTEDRERILELLADEPDVLDLTHPRRARRRARPGAGYRVVALVGARPSARGGVGMSDDEVSITMSFPDEVVQLDLTPEEAHEAWCRGRAVAHFAEDAEPIVTEDGRLGERHVTDAEQQRRAQGADRTDH